jgi:hypothetical protein
LFFNYNEITGFFFNLKDPSCILSPFALLTTKAIITKMPSLCVQDWERLSSSWDLFFASVDYFLLRSLLPLFAVMNFDNQNCTLPS